MRIQIALEERVLLDKSCNFLSACFYFSGPQLALNKVHRSWREDGETPDVESR